MFLLFDVLKELFLGDTYTWLAIFGLRHAANPLWWIDGKWQGVAAFCCFLWTIVCLGISGLGMASAFMPLYQGPLSIFARILIGCHNFTPLFVYGCLIKIFRNPSDPPIFEEDVCDGGNPLQPSLNPLNDDTDYDDNNAPNSNLWTKVTDGVFDFFQVAFFTFIGLCWVLFLGSWGFFISWYHKEASNQNSPFTPGPSTPNDPHVQIYLAIVITYLFRVWPVILVTRLIVINFEKFEEVAKKLYLYHRQKPPVHVVVGVVPTHYLKDVGNSPLTTHDLFFMENLHECRSVKYEMSECDGFLDFKVTLVEKGDQRTFSPILDKRLCLKVEDQNEKNPLRVKEKILPLCDSWTPFIGVRVPGTTVRISEAQTRRYCDPIFVGMDVPITETTLLRSAYEVAGFKKQDQGSCFPYRYNRTLQKGSADFHETAIILRSPGQSQPPDQIWAWTHANDLRKRKLCQHKYFRIQIKTPPAKRALSAQDDYQPSAELMAQLIRNARLKMNAFLEKYGGIFWFVVVVPLVNTMVFVVDILLPGNDVCVLSRFLFIIYPHA